jgi:hypothetical protein
VAELLDRTPRTLVRWEEQGILTPIKLNCRSVVYAREQVERIVRGEVDTGHPRLSITHVARGTGGTFLPQPVTS